MPNKGEKYKFSPLITLKGQSKSRPRSTFKNAHSVQKSHKKASGNVNMHIMHSTVTQLCMGMPEKGETGFSMGL